MSQLFHQRCLLDWTRISFNLYHTCIFLFSKGRLQSQVTDTRTDFHLLFFRLKHVPFQPSWYRLHLIFQAICLAWAIREVWSMFSTSRPWVRLSLEWVAFQNGAPKTEVHELRRLSEYNCHQLKCRCVWCKSCAVSTACIKELIPGISTHKWVYHGSHKPKSYHQART